MYECKIALYSDISELVKIRMLDQLELRSVLNNEDKDFKKLEEQTKKCLIKRLNKDLFGFVIKKDNKIVATAFIIIQEYLPEESNLTGIRAYLCNVYTVKEERKKGLQKLLFNKIVSFVKAKGIGNIDLHATPMKSVFDMYKKMGYEFTNNNAVLNLNKIK